MIKNRILCKMSYRIIKKAYNDGTHEYIVQKNRILRFIP